MCMVILFSNQMPKQNVIEKHPVTSLFEQDDGVSYCLCLTFSFMPRQTAGCNYTLVLMEAADHTEACIPFFLEEWVRGGGYLFS